MAFAMCHSLVKVLLAVWRTKWMMSTLKHLPGAELDLKVEKYRANMSRLHDFKTEFHRQYPGAKLIRTHGPDPELMVLEPMFIKHFLKTEFDRNTKPSRDEDGLFDNLGEWLGEEGIFVIRHGTKVLPQDHAIWYTQRKTASKLFTRGNFQELMWQAFAKKLDILVEVIDNAATSNKPIDIQEKFFSFTFDSIQKIFFDREVDSVSGKMDPYASAFDAAHREMMQFTIRTLPLYLLTKHVLPFPFGRLFPNSRHSGFLWPLYRMTNPYYQAFRCNVDYLHEETDKYVAAARASTPDILESRQDLLAYFLKAEANGGQRIPDHRLRDIILNFIIAGRDTTACTLSWMFFYLATNPEVQEKAASEVREVFGCRIPRLEELTPDNAPYLHGVLYETLRLAPPVPEDSKIVTQEMVFPDGTHVLPGVRLGYMPYSMGRDPLTYEDPEAFRPERWVPFEPFAQDPDFQYKFPVFQSGNRVCLGASMAQFEAKMVAATLLGKFSFELAPDEKKDNYHYAFMLTMSVCNNREQTSHQVNLSFKRRVNLNIQ